MKWYSHRSYKQHLEDLKSFKDSNEVRQQFMSWARTMSSRFDRTYPRVGILDQSDLLQEGYVAFYKCWDDINWKLVMSKHPNERIAMITSYLKRRIHDRIKRAIARDRDTIRIPENYYVMNPYGHTHELSKYNSNMQTDIFLTRTFSTFFDQSILDAADESRNYIADELNEVLHDIMRIFLTSFEETVVKQSYGIDEPHDKPKSIKRIAEYCGKSEIWIKKTKAKALDKLRQKEIIEIIEKNIENLYTI